MSHFLCEKSADLLLFCDKARQTDKHFEQCRAEASFILFNLLLIFEGRTVMMGTASLLLLLGFLATVMVTVTSVLGG